MFIFFERCHCIELPQTEVAENPHQSRHDIAHESLTLMTTIKSIDELAKVAALSAANALKQHGVDAKHIKAGEGVVASHPDKHWIGIWIDGNPNIPTGGIHGPIWIGIIAEKFDPKVNVQVKSALKEAGFGH